MKIGILTFHCAHNYGAVLQAYALQEYFKDLNYDVEIIDYRPSYIVEPFKPFSVKGIFTGNYKRIIHKFLSSILLYPKMVKRWRVFNEFIINNFKLSDNPNNLIPKDYDIYVIGSDQVWNDLITKGFDNIYWGHFITKQNAKKISYAASFGSTANLEEKHSFLKKSTPNFNGISLREEDHIAFLESIYKKKVYKVLDPTLLIDKQKWHEKAKKPNTEKKYVLVYQVIRSDEAIKIAEYIASQINGTVIEIPGNKSIRNINNKYFNVSPFEFIGWIENAHTVVTTSFHGTVFSLIFEKDFYFYNMDNGSEKRSKDLLYSLDLSERLISNNFDYIAKPIDYASCNNKIDFLKEYSYSYLSKYLYPDKDN